MREYTADKANVTASPTSASTPLPATPLIEAVSQHGGLGRLTGQRHDPESRRLRRAYHRAAQRGWVHYTAADELACRLLRCHPVQLWGLDFWRGTS